VVHTNVGTYESTVSWFARAESAVSSHYLVALDGRIGQFVDESDTARHAGRVLNPTATFLEDANPNLYTVGIEFEDGGDPLGVSRPDSQYAAGAELIAAIARRWEIPLDAERIVGHRAVFAAKDCPGNLDVSRLIDQARVCE
jgi:N-acetyl-anhydromuramyl-L-alanine amidase AmpD